MAKPAKTDVVVVDDLGVRRRIRAGRPVPTHLQAAYDKAMKDEAPKKTEAKAEKTPEEHKAQVAPEVDKAERAPEAAKSQSRRRKED